VLGDGSRAPLAVREILPGKRPRSFARHVIDPSVASQPNAPAGFVDPVIQFKILIVRELLIISVDAQEVLEFEQSMMTVIHEF
jgi:hypothetical protein